MKEVSIKNRREVAMQEMDESALTGLFAVSRAGHDVGEYYIIIKETERDVYLADGKTKTMEHPKRKSKKHIQIIKKGYSPEVKRKLQDGEKVSNEEIKYLIKLNFQGKREGLYVEV